MAAPAQFQLQLVLLSLAVIVLEIAYTRILSFKLVYYFTYLVIGLALLGLGAGGILVSVSERLRASATQRLVAGSALASAVTIVVGYLGIARLQLNAFDLVQAVVRRDSLVAVQEGMTLLLVSTLLALPFLCAGIAITAILATQPARAARLYFADLAGAALGCVASVPLMAAISPPGCVMLAGACAATATLPGARRSSRWAIVLGIAALLALAARADLLPDPVVDRVKTLAPQDPPHQVLFSRWSPVFRVDVLEPTADFLQGQRFKMLVHDGMWGSIMRANGHDPDTGAFLERDARRLPFTVLRPDPRVVIIGAAGGAEVLASLAQGAAHVTAIELNPVTVSLLTDQFAAFTGHLATHPRVTLVCAEGRNWLMRHRQAVDLVWFVAPDSYAAMNAATSGAYVLSESYLYTAETISESLDRLAPGGVVAIQFGEVDFEHKPNRTLRYLVTAREALRRRGVPAPGRHVLVGTTAGFGFTSSTILVRAEPFSEADAARFVSATQRLDGGRVRWAPPEMPPGPVATVLGSDDAALARWLATWPFQVSAVEDNAPFFWHFVSFRQALRTTPAGRIGALELGVGEQLLVALLCSAALVAFMLLGVPLIARRLHWRQMRGKARAGLYFAALGVGFMCFEIALIQRLTLFLGYPTYSLSVTLCGVLLSTGLGALWSDRTRLSSRQVLPRLLAVLGGLVLLYRAGLPIVIAAGLGAELPLRIGLALALVAPLGLCLGTFLPLGLRTVAALGPYPTEYVAWAWAINGFFSVLSSLLATMLAMSAGFDVVFLVGFVAYALGVAAFLGLPAPAFSPAVPRTG